jgi:D-proline reductase (dithiol) PrdA
VLSAQDFEDPTIFDDMVESNLMTLTDDGLTIAEALGATLTSDGEALTQLTADLLDGVNPSGLSGLSPSGSGDAEPPAPAPTAPAVAPVAGTTTVTPGDVAPGYLHLHVAEAKDLDLILPVSGGPVPTTSPPPRPPPPHQTPPPSSLPRSASCAPW